MKKMLLTGLVLAPAVWMAACGEKKPIETPDTIGPIQPKPSTYLRSAFDTDPSGYLGRFVDAGQVMDESGAMQLTCSQHVSYKKIGGGGVQYDEVYQASQSAAASFNIPMTASGSAGSESGTNVRVKYTLTSKMVAEIEDPAAFEACCKAAPDQCTDTYIGEFLEGSGELFYATASGKQGKGGATTPQGGLEVEMKNGVAWAKSITFPNPVYFAFKTTKNPWAGGVDAGCGDWVNAPPRTTQGHYFVGLSNPMESERVARDAAMKDARVQTVKWMGEAIATGSTEAKVDEGRAAAVQSAMRSDEIIETAAQGVASNVKDENWCVTTTDTPSGVLYTAKVLAFVPKEAEQEVAEALVKASE